MEIITGCISNTNKRQHTQTTTTTTNATQPTGGGALSVLSAYFRAGPPAAPPPPIPPPVLVAAAVSLETTRVSARFSDFNFSFSDFSFWSCCKKKTWNGLLPLYYNINLSLKRKEVVDRSHGSCQLDNDKAAVSRNQTSHETSLRDRQKQPLLNINM